MESDFKKLHLCCGMRNFGDGWINVDAINADHVHYIIRDLDRLPFAENTFDLIYCSHAIGYFDREEIVPVLAEWRRVLKKGGTLRIATPDFDSINYIYRTGKVDLCDVLGLLYGKWNIQGRGDIYFKTTYDFVSLNKLLLDSGFSQARIYDFRDTEHSVFDDHSKAHLPHDKDAIRTGVFTEKHTLVSLNVECKKP